MKNKLKVSEKDLKKSICDYLAIEGWKVFRLFQGGIYSNRSQGYFFHSNKGLPDLVCLKKGFPILFLEVKRSGGKVSPEQKEVIELIRSTPEGWAKVIFCLEELIEIISGLEDIYK